MLAAFVAACAGVNLPPAPGATTPRLAEQAVIAPDGWRLPLEAALPQDGPPRAVILALHGMNDYAAAFRGPAAWWAAQGVATYAYDQRGFGRGAGAGYWHGHDAMAADAVAVAALLKGRHPDAPLFLLGESMGGAVALLAAARGAPVDGLILSAPAVRSRATLPGIYRAVLGLLYDLFPGGWFTGEGVFIQPSDNIPMLRALGRDPLVLKRTRVDSIWGLVNLMDAAVAATPDLPARLPVLVLYGQRDFFIPERPTESFIRALPPGARVAAYRRGWHMLLRDLQAETVWRDVAAFVAAPGAPLPSGEEARSLPLFPDRDRRPVFIERVTTAP